MRRILVGYDGSGGARRALDRAIAEAGRSRGRITVLIVANVPLDPNVPRNFGTIDDISAGERLGEHQHGFLTRLFGADVDAEVKREAGCDVILA